MLVRYHAQNRAPLWAETDSFELGFASELATQKDPRQTYNRLSWTSDNIKSLFRSALASVYVLLEIGTLAFGEALVWRAALVGGVGKEITGLERFKRDSDLPSCAYNALHSRYNHSVAISLLARP